MKTALVFLVLCSELSCCTSASNRLRLFLYNKTRQTFNDSMLECKEKGASLVTLYDEEEATFIDNIFELENEKLWLGLTRKKENFTTWSDNTPVLPEYNVTVSMWEQKCGAFENNKLTHENCNEPRYFMCYQGSSYTLIEEEKDWCQALQHCRRNFTDLVSITNNTTPQQLIEEGKNTNFWVGLMHDQWKWADGGCSTFREWHEQSQDNSALYTTLHRSALIPLSQGNTEHTFCSKGYVRIQVIDRRFTWERAFNYCNEHHTGPLRIENEIDQEAVEQRLKYTTTEDIDGPFWIGLRQSRIFGFWIWSNTTAVYSNWKDSIQPGPPMSHLCGAIHRNGSWINKECWQMLPFLCEEEMFFMSDAEEMV